MSQLKKLEGSQNYAADEFNRKFVSKDESLYDTESESVDDSKKASFKKNIDLDIDDNIDIEDSDEYMNDLGVNIKNLFFKLLEILANGENPIPYIMENSKRQFVFAVMIIGIGGLMLFLSNLMVT